MDEAMLVALLHALPAGVTEIYLHPGFYLKSELQYENISHFPILFTGPQTNVTAIVEAGFMPERRK